MASGVILTNVPAIIAQRNLSATSARFTKEVSRLSSGLRIVNSGDDAAGLAISEKITNELRGINQALRNAQDGTSMLQVAEGGLGEIHSLVGRIRELAVQASNGTYTDADRVTLNNESKQLLAEIDRISTSTDFNTRNLLDGSAGVSIASTNPANITNATGTADTATGTLALTGTAAAKAQSAVTNAGFATAASTLSAPSTLNVNGIAFSFTTTNTVQSVLDSVNQSGAGVTASYSGTTITFTNNKSGSTNTNVVSGTGDLATVANTVLPTDANVTGAGGTLKRVGNHITVLDGNYKGLEFDVLASGPVSLNIGTNNAIKLQVGAFSGQTIGLTIDAVSTAGLKLNNIDISTLAGANAALTNVDAATDTVSLQRSKIGAVESRLNHTVANLSVASENLSAANSRIRDLDVTAETVNFTRDQILQTAGIAVLAQANQAPQALLALLR